MKKQELQERATKIIEKMSGAWKGTKADFMKFVSSKKTKKAVEKAAKTGSIIALSALLTACSMGVENKDGRFGVYFDIHDNEKSSQSATLAPEATSDPNGITGTPNGNNGLIFGGDGQDWGNDTTTGSNDDYNDNYYDNNLNGSTSGTTTPSVNPTNPTNPTAPSDWEDSGVHFGGDNDGVSYDTTDSNQTTPDPTNPNPTNPTNPIENIEPTNPTNPTDPTNPIDPTNPTDSTSPVVSTEGSSMDKMLSALMGENVKVLSVKVTLDSNGDVAVYDMENGMSGQCVELKCSFALCDEYGNLVADKNGEVGTYIYTLLVSREAYNIASNGNSLPEITGDEIETIFGENFVDAVAREYGVALPTDYGKGGM